MRLWDCLTMRPSDYVTASTIVLQTSRKGCLCLGLSWMPAFFASDWFDCQTIWLCNCLTRQLSEYATIWLCNRLSERLDYVTVWLCDRLTIQLPWQTVQHTSRKGCLCSGLSWMPASLAREWLISSWPCLNRGIWLTWHFTPFILSF